MSRTRARTIASALCVAALISAARAEDQAFTVGNYPVEARAKDAVSAKDKAMADGQQAAFRSLLKRIVPVTAYSRIEQLRSVKAADFVTGVAVRSERNSSTEYIASLDFSFQPEAVRGLLRREAVPFIDAQAPAAVMIPVVQDAQNAANSAGGSGTWAATWKDLDLEHTLTPLKIETLKPEIHADTLAMLAAGEDDAARILTGEYKSDLVILAHAEQDQAGQRLIVTLAGTDAVGPINWKRSYRLVDGDLAYTMELAAVVSLGVLEGRWKTVKAAARGGADVMAGPGMQVDIDVEFSSLSEWNDLRRQLLETPGVEDVRIDAVSARNALVSLRYPGGGMQLAEALAQQGLTLRNTGVGWLLRASF